jgi:hypothetical protein
MNGQEEFWNSEITGIDAAGAKKYDFHTAMNADGSVSIGEAGHPSVSIELGVDGTTHSSGAGLDEIAAALTAALVDLPAPGHPRRRRGRVPPGRFAGRRSDPERAREQLFARSVEPRLELPDQSRHQHAVRGRSAHVQRERPDAPDPHVGVERREHQSGAR